MPQAVVGYGVTPCQVDGFPEKCERSRKGALYIRPRSTLTLTNDELEHIKAKYPNLYKKLRIVEEPRKRPAPKKEPKVNPSKAPLDAGKIIRQQKEKDQGIVAP